MRWQVCLSGLLALPAIAPPGYCGVRPAEEAVVTAVAEAEVAEPEMLLEVDDEGDAVEIGGGEEFAGFALTVAGDDGGDSGSLKLSPEEDKALKELVQKAAALQVPKFKKELERKGSALIEKAGLDKAGKEKLEALIPKAAEAAGAAWEQKAREWMLTYMAQSGDATETLKSWKPETLSSTAQNVAPVSPEASDVWKAGLKDILPAAMLTTLDEDEKARVAKVREEMADYLNASESRAADVFAGVMENTLARIERFGGIDAERFKKLKKTADEAVKTTTAEWRARAESQLLAMDPKARDQMAKNGGYMGVSTADKANQPQEQKAWKDAVAQTLTDAERKLISESRIAVRERRA
ncbi:MAG TPA: hypothetical protein VHM91_03165, partial [Verrucomicrobiales bacterium]|nr:hypothetical protein [Verrucomicrobiales bacterium]